MTEEQAERLINILESIKTYLQVFLWALVIIGPSLFIRVVFGWRH